MRTSVYLWYSLLSYPHGSIFLKVINQLGNILFGLSYNFSLVNLVQVKCRNNKVPWTLFSACKDETNQMFKHQG